MITSLYNILKRRWTDIRLRDSNPNNVAGPRLISALAFQECQSDNIKESVGFPVLKPYFIETNKLTDLIERLTSSNENLSRDFQMFKSKIEHQMNSFDARLKTITIQAQSNNWACFSLVFSIVGLKVSCKCFVTSSCSDKRKMFKFNSFIFQNYKRCSWLISTRSFKTITLNNDYRWGWYNSLQ